MAAVKGTSKRQRDIDMQTGFSAKAPARLFKVGLMCQQERAEKHYQNLIAIDNNNVSRLECFMPCIAWLCGEGSQIKSFDVLALLEKSHLALPFAPSFGDIQIRVLPLFFPCFL